MFPQREGKSCNSHEANNDTVVSGKQSCYLTRGNRIVDYKRHRAVSFFWKKKSMAPEEGKATYRVAASRKKKQKRMLSQATILENKAWPLTVYMDGNKSSIYKMAKYL